MANPAPLRETGRPLPPAWRDLAPTLIEAARQEGERTDRTDPRLWEARVPEPAGRVMAGKEALRWDSYFPDRDAAHYARGHVKIVHVFVNGTGQTWTVAEKDAAAASAAVAKGYFSSWAPAGAEIHFDNDEPGYYYMSVTLPYAVPTDGFTWEMAEEALGLMGYTDDDGDGFIRGDFTVQQQGDPGGWDVVIACFEPHVTGRSYAGTRTSSVILYTNVDGAVFAHEWGHNLGECDEYEQGGHCTGDESDVDCGACQSTYLPAIVDNGNCELVTCPSDVPCIMKHTTVGAICDYTLKHWAWWDSNSDGVLDQVRRRASSTTLVPIVELLDGVPVTTNETIPGWVYGQGIDRWAVTAVQNPATADYYLMLYGDNNHNYAYASSNVGGTSIDFVVGDYNHCRFGLDHVQVLRAAGDNANYILEHDSGGGLVYPDGVARTKTFGSGRIVQVYDLPLFEGESTPITLTVTSGSLDLGMSLFRSNGSHYWAGRGSAQWTRDAAGAGGTETRTYIAPTDDLYGLVVFSKTAGSGSYTIQVGSATVALTEETPYTSSAAAQNYSYRPVDATWSFAGVRPDPSTDVNLTLYDVLQPGAELETSDDFDSGHVEFVVADYSGGVSIDFPRVTRVAGSGSHIMEWEHGAEVLTGMTSDTWIAGHVGKIWDVYLTAGRSYFVREYHDPAGGLDTGVYLFSSADGDRYKNRRTYMGVGDNWTPSVGGEWFSVTAPATDTYGLCQIVNDASVGDYSIWLGRQKALTDRERFPCDETVAFTSATVSTGNWAAFGVRPPAPYHGGAWLFGSDSYSESSLLASDESTNPVLYVVGDYNHNSSTAAYPRFRRTSGALPMEIQFETGPELITFDPAQIVSADNIFFPADVLVIYDLFVNAGTPGRDVTVRVDDLSGTMDLGLALFKSSNSDYYAGQASAWSQSDAQGIGGSESFTRAFSRGDTYGLVVYKKMASGNGFFRISVADPAVMGTDEPHPSVSFGLSIRSANPSTGPVVLGIALPSAGEASLTLYDVQGRVVRTILDRAMPPGAGTVTWNGVGDAGNDLPGGVYVAVLRANAAERRVKIVRVR